MLAYRDVIIPDLKRLVDGVSLSSTKNMIMVKHEDDVGLHQDKTYLLFMQNKFHQYD